MAGRRSLHVRLDDARSIPRFPPGLGAEPPDWVAIVLLALLVLPLVGRAAAEEELPQLIKHPLADAKPGEYLVYREKAEGERWTSYFCERVLAVKDGKVLWELSKTDEDGKDHGPLKTKWRTVDELKPNRYQTVTKDEMVVL